MDTHMQQLSYLYCALITPQKASYVIGSFLGVRNIFLQLVAALCNVVLAVIHPVAMATHHS